MQRNVTKNETVYDLLKHNSIMEEMDEGKGREKREGGKKKRKKSLWKGRIDGV